MSWFNPLPVSPSHSFSQKRDEPEATSKPDTPAETADPALAQVAAAPAVDVAPPPTATAGPDGKEGADARIPPERAICHELDTTR